MFSISHADMIVPRGGSNKVAIDLIVKHVIRELNKRKQNIKRSTQVLKISNYVLNKLKFVYINIWLMYKNLGSDECGTSRLAQTFTSNISE